MQQCIYAALGGDELIPFNASKIEIDSLRLWTYLWNIAFLMEIAKAHMTQFSELSFVKESWQSIMSCSITTLEINSKWHVQLIGMPEKLHGSDLEFLTNTQYHKRNIIILSKLCFYNIIAFWCLVLIVFAMIYKVLRYSLQKYLTNQY